MSYRSLLFAVMLFASMWFPATCMNCSSFLNKSNYTTIETLILTDENLAELENSFFPTNLHSSILVDVYYNLEGSFQSEAVQSDLKDGTNENIWYYYDLDHRKKPHVIEPLKNVSLHFRWSASPINLYMRHSLLNRLSLATYWTNPLSVEVQLQLPCNQEEIQAAFTPQVHDTVDDFCINPDRFLIHLNSATANVSQHLLVHGTAWNN